MGITRLSVTVSDVAAAADFFSQVLELDVQQGEGRVEVAIGSTTLVLSPGLQERGAHHLAFEVPVASFEAHRRWLAGRVPLLAGTDGTTEFEGPAHWRSRSVYFSGPDAMVLELICRRPRPQPERVTRPPQLLSVSEVGVAVPDVLGTVRQLRSGGLRPYGTPTAGFAPVGDPLGLLILVSPGRGWLPVFDVTAEPLPLTVEVTTGASGSKPHREDAERGPGTGTEVPLNDRAVLRIPGWEG